MSYTPYLISNYATGLEKRLQPWLIPDDAQEELFDGYVYRGTLSKRTGYKYFATGQRPAPSFQPYCESRIVNNIPKEPVRTSVGVLVLGTGVAGPYTFRLQNLPLRRGTVVITAGAQVATDNGLGKFTGDVAAPPSGSIDYTTGDVTITFAAAVPAVQIYANYDYHPGLPVMGIMNFITTADVKVLVVADTKRLNIYDPTKNILNYLGRTVAITGITAANPGVVTAVAHGLSTGDTVFISGVLGMNEVNNNQYVIIRINANTFSIVDTSAFTAYISGGTLELIHTGTLSPASNFYSWVNYPDKDGNPRLLFTNNKNQVGYYAPNLNPAVGNYVSYPDFAPASDFYMKSSDFIPVDITTISCTQLVLNKDRLLMLRTTENGIVRPQRIRISGTGRSCDDFRTSATGAGFIDIPDGSWIQGASFNRDDLLIFTERSTWVLKYTGNDSTPFVLNKIDESRGSEAVFSAFTYLNRTSAASPRGLIISDGYRVERQDISIPDFSFNEVYGKNFNLCFAGSVDEDRDHYLIYPEQGQNESTRILITNYDEDNYNISRLPLSCMGNFITSFDTTWDDLLRFSTWDEFATEYDNWLNFSFSAGAPFSLGGGHKGEIWTLNVNTGEDNPVKIRNITEINSTTLEITTDWNNFSLNRYDQEKGADTIFFAGVQGMVEVNNQQYDMVSFIDNHTFRVTVPANIDFQDYISGGTCSRVIPFSALFKKFNPFVDADKKVRCGWIYFYVDSTGTNLVRQIPIRAATKADPCEITTDTAHNLTTGDIVSIISAGGMTQLNNRNYIVTVLSVDTFTLQGVDSTGYTLYTSGGYVTIPEDAKMDIDIIVNDVDHTTQLDNSNRVPYEGTCTNLVFEDGSKKWYKVFINQTGRFIQFRLRNRQAGANINIQATMPGFQPVGRLI